MTLIDMKVVELKFEIYNKAMANIKKQGKWFDGCDYAVLKDAFNFLASNEGPDYWEHIVNNPKEYSSLENNVPKDITDTDKFILKFKNQDSYIWESRELIADLGSEFKFRYITVKPHEKGKGLLHKAYEFKLVEVSKEDAQTVLNDIASGEGIQYNII
jgi:hypothetical protein